MNELTWNVYRYNINQNTIYQYNVFDHYTFYCDVLASLKTSKNKDEFSEKLRKDAMYYFWSKAEHEVVITSFPPYINRKEFDRLASGDWKIRECVDLEHGVKVDIYSQLMMNWDRFVDYVWNSKER